MLRAVAFLQLLQCRSADGNVIKLDYGPDGCDKADTCAECKGFCFADIECGTGLYCFNREDNTQVPGCGVGGTGDVPGYSYCTKPPEYKMLGCYKDDVYGKKTGMIIDPNARLGVLKTCMVACIGKCYMAVQRTEDNVICHCSDTLQLKNQAVGLFECDDQGVKLADCSQKYGCGSKSRISVYGRSGDGGSSCFGNALWAPVEPATDAFKSCSVKASKKVTLSSQPIIGLVRANNADECRKRCELNRDCGCWSLSGTNCGGYQWGNCEENKAGGTQLYVCDTKPLSFQRIGCYKYDTKQQTDKIFGSNGQVATMDVKACMSLCKGLCYMAIWKGKECMCHDSPTSLEKIQNLHCSAGCDISRSCGGTKAMTVWVNNGVGSKCYGKSSWPKMCSYVKQNTLRGYAYKVISHMESPALSAEYCRFQCEKDIKCGCFTFAPRTGIEGGCALKPKGLNCGVLVESKDSNAVAGVCGEFPVTVPKQTRKSLENSVVFADFKSIGCYDDTDDKDESFADGHSTVASLEECRIKCEQRCFMALKDGTKCYCSDKPNLVVTSSQSQKHKAVPLEKCNSKLPSNAQCNPKYGCGGSKHLSVYANVGKAVCAKGKTWAPQLVPPRKTSRSCSRFDGYVNTLGKSVVKAGGGKYTVESCRQTCEERLDCACWTFIGKNQKTCWLKSSKDDGKKCKLVQQTGADWNEGASGSCNDKPTEFSRLGCFKQESNSDPIMGGGVHVKVKTVKQCMEQCRYTCYMSITEGKCECSDKPIISSISTDKMVDTKDFCTYTSTSGSNTCWKGACGGSGGYHTVYRNEMMRSTSKCDGSDHTPRFWYKGCYQQATSTRIFPYPKDKNGGGSKHLWTPEDCMKFCKDYCFMALQQMRECRCGDTVDRWEKKKKEVGATKCNAAITGALKSGVCGVSLCGGTGHDAVYVNNRPPKTKTCPKVEPSSGDWTLK